MKHLKILVLTMMFCNLCIGSALVLAEESQVESIMKWTQCSSQCVDNMDACMVQKKKECAGLKNDAASACFMPCNDAYTNCLGACPKPNIDNLGGIPPAEEVK